MTSIILTVHILVAIALIVVVLIQRGQGSDIGASFGGGGAQTLFGSRGSGSFLGKLTGGLAATFMVTSLTLAFFTQQDAGSLVERSAPIQQPSLPSSDAETPAGFDPATLEKQLDELPAAQGESQSASVEIPVAGDTQPTSSPETSSAPASGSSLPSSEGNQ